MMYMDNISKHQTEQLVIVPPLPASSESSGTSCVLVFEAIPKICLLKNPRSISLDTSHMPKKLPFPCHVWPCKSCVPYLHDRDPQWHPTCQQILVCMHANKSITYPPCSPLLFSVRGHDKHRSCTSHTHIRVGQLYVPSSHPQCLAFPGLLC